MKIIRSLKKRIIYLTIELPRKIKYKLLSTGTNIKGKPNFVQPFQINGNGFISFGKNVMLGVSPSPFLYSGYGYIEARNKNSQIVIHDNVMINNNVVIISEGEGIVISSDTLIGTQCEMYDSDFHDLDIDKRLNGEINTAGVFIDENVFIGSNVKILKGVTIGKNSIIANGSVVTKAIPMNVIAGGVPAKVIREL